MVNVEKLMVNYEENPIGIEGVEQIGWTICSDRKNVHQRAYWLQIASDAVFASVVYDSGRVETEESAHVAVGQDDLRLTSTTKYWIRVKVETESGSYAADAESAANTEESEWTEGSFVTALLSHEEWKAKFVTIEEETDKEDSKGSYLRTEFSARKEIACAYAYTTALGLYHLYLNGEKVSEDEFTPGWTSYNKHLLYQMYDVSTYIKEGSNVIGALIGAGWYKGTMGFVRMRNHYGERTAFAAQLEICYTDGSKDIIVTDESWVGAWSPILYSEIYDGETYDARLEIKNWNKTDCKYCDWKIVNTVEFDCRVLRAQSGCKVKPVTALPAKRIFMTPQGDKVVDFGQNLTGWVTFTVKGSVGSRVVLQFFETLDQDGNVYLDNLRTAKQTVTYVCRDEYEVCFHPHFSYQGFQFMKIIEYPGESSLKNFMAYAVHSDMAKTGSFSCSNEDLNQLMHNVLWGMKGNFLDVPTDCPQRDERLGWTGDAQIFCRTATYLMDTYTFYTKWLRDVEADQTEEGGVPHVVPDLLIGKSEHDRLMKDGDHSAAAWADVAVILPWTLYLMYGDTNVIRNQYNSMKAWIEFMRAHANGNIWNYKLQFGDWVALDAEEGSYFGATPNDLTCTAYYAYSTGLFAKMAKIIGNHEDAQEYRTLYEEIVTTYQDTFFGKDGRMTVQTQTAQIVSLYFGLVPEDSKKTVAADLIGLLKKENGHLVTGFVGTPYFCHALSQNGYTDEAYALLLKEDFPSWLYQVKQGATTIWEHWDGLKPDGTMWSPDMNSFNHYAYGAVAEWIFRVMAGIECDECRPGYKHTMIAPKIGGNLSYVKASYQSIYGKVAVFWKVEGNEVILEVEVPCNTTAEIRLDQAKSVIDADGLTFMWADVIEGQTDSQSMSNRSGQMYAQTGSGSYCIRYER